MTHDEIIAVVTAHKSGKTIQWKGKNVSAGDWVDAVRFEPSWDFLCNEYRVKPEPHVLWVNVYDPRGEETYKRTGNTYGTREEAERNRYRPGRTVKFIEDLS